MLLRYGRILSRTGERPRQSARSGSGGRRRGQFDNERHRALSYGMNIVSAADGTRALSFRPGSPEPKASVYSSVATNALRSTRTGGDINDGTTDAAVTIEGKTHSIFDSYGRNDVGRGLHGERQQIDQPSRIDNPRQLRRRVADTRTFTNHATKLFEGRENG